MWERSSVQAVSHFNDIFHKLQSNVRALTEAFQEDVYYVANKGMDMLIDISMNLHDKRKSKMLLDSFDELTSKNSKNCKGLFIKKDFDEDIIQNQPKPSANMSFGSNIANNQTVQDQHIIEDEFTFSPLYKSMVKQPTQTKPQFLPFSQPKGNQKKTFDPIRQKILKEAQASFEAEEPPKPPGQHSVQDLILSIKKMACDIDKENMDDDVQYIMTDYSSNESSNNNSYHYEYFDEKDNSQNFNILNSINNDSASLFAPNKMTTQPQVLFDFSKFALLKEANSNSTAVSQQIKPNVLMQSPIKTPTKKKRLYCRSKKIPKWAEDLKKVAEVNKGKDPEDIFGVCIVQQLNTAFLFPQRAQLDCRRTSSAKWNRFD